MRSALSRIRHFEIRACGKRGDLVKYWRSDEGRRMSPRFGTPEFPRGRGELVGKLVRPIFPLWRFQTQRTLNCKGRVPNREGRVPMELQREGGGLRLSPLSLRLFPQPPSSVGRVPMVLARACPQPRGACPHVAQGVSLNAGDCPQ